MNQWSGPRRGTHPKDYISRKSNKLWGESLRLYAQSPQELVDLPLRLLLPLFRLGEIFSQRFELAFLGIELVQPRLELRGLARNSPHRLQRAANSVLIAQDLANLFPLARNAAGQLVQVVLQPRQPFERPLEGCIYDFAVQAESRFGSSPGY